MTKLILDPILEGSKLSIQTRRELRRSWDQNIARGAQEVQLRTAVFDGDLRAGYRAESSLFRSGEISGTLSNNTPNSLFRERGRPPGKFPPFFPGSPLERWARAKGINAFLVARKIAEQGTERWRKNENALGIDRNDTRDSINPKPNGVVQGIVDGIISDGNNLKL